MLHTLVALSILLGFAAAEFLGILTGGLISAGYLAYYFQEPTRIVSTLLMAVLICLLVKVAKHFLILYGRRRFMLTVMLSLLSVWLVEKSYYYLASVAVDIRMIGYIVPGLIANDMEKQGILKTLLALVAVVVVIRLIYMLGVLS